MMKESFHLAASKIDPAALGCWRTWGCVCSGHIQGTLALCPYHAAKAQVTMLHDRFGNLKVGDLSPISRSFRTSRA
eukprot:3910955-Amphidinium_carterae.1